MNLIDLANIAENENIREAGIKTLIIITILIATLILAKLAKGFIQRKIEKSTIDVTHLNFIKHILSGTIYFIGFALMIFQIDYLKTIAISILASSGIIAVIIGFASQQAFANLVSGLFISFFKPFRIGDRVRFIDRETTGIVEDITLRHTVIRTFENKRIFIPNSIMNNEMIENANIVEDKVCSYLDISISYNSHIDKASNIIKDLVQRHKDYLDNRNQEEIESGVEPVQVKLIGFGEFSLNLRAWVWAKDPATSFDMICDLRKSIKERFDSEGIEIPYRHRTIVLKRM